MPDYDVAVVGAGPAGSTAAYHLSRAGARVLLIDRAKFPRDKPCGGGVTARAHGQAPVDLTPVVEQAVRRVRFSYRLGSGFDYEYAQPLVYMTQRLRLDEFLAGQAAAAGAELQDGRLVRAIEYDRDGVRLVLDGDVFRAAVVIGADGSNGVVARSAGLAPVKDPPVALEANFPYGANAISPEWDGKLAIELGSLAGGYGWSFPKADHFNVGCGGWSSEGTRLRQHLAGLRRHYGLDGVAMENLRGHHLPTRTEGSPIAHGRALLVGDAAGLVDPMSGEGIHGAFVSGRLAAAAVLPFLAGAQPDLWGYEAAIEREIMPEIRAATILRDAYHYWPRPCYEAMRYLAPFRRSLCQVISGEQTYAGVLRSFGPLLPFVRYWGARGRAARGA